MDPKSKGKEPCPECGKDFPRNGHLNRHIREVHKINLFKRVRPENPPTFKCPLVHLNVPCTAIFRSKRSLQRHKQKYNLENKPPKPKSSIRKSTTRPSAAELETYRKDEKVNAILNTFPNGCSVNFDYRVTRFVESPLLVEYEFGITDLSEIKDWKKKYEEKNKIFFRKDRTCKSRKDCVVYKQRYHCGRYIPDQRNCKHGERNTNCPFSFSIRVKKEKNSSLVVRIQLKNEHNHDLESAESVKFRPVSEEVREKFLCLFHYGYTPARALKTHLKDLEDEYEDGIDNIKGDRYYCPDMNWVNRLYDNTFKREYGSKYGEKMLEDLSKKVEQSKCAKLCVLDDSFNYVVAIVAPFMLRVHEEIDLSSELVFMTSTDTLERLDCTVFILFTNSTTGALPLGVIMTTTDDKKSIISGLRMLQELLPKSSFGSRGAEKGPASFITDRNAVERSALREVFPESKFLYSQFQILQAMWHYIWSDDSNIRSCDRTTLFSLFKAIVYEKDIEIFEIKLTQMLTNETARMYGEFLKRFEDVIKSKESWATCYRTNLNATGQPTNDICESEMRVIKDVILEGSSAFSPVHLFSIVKTEFETYFVDKLMSMSNGLFPNYLIDKLQKLTKQCAKEDSIASNENTHSVDTESGLCSCYFAMDGGICKHLLIALREHHIESNWIIPSSDSERKKLYYLATGQILECENEWLSEQDVSHNLESLPGDTFLVEVMEEEEEGASHNFEDFDVMCDEIKSMALLQASIKSAITEMVHAYRTIKTPAALESALRSFGRYSIENIIMEH